MGVSSSSRFSRFISLFVGIGAVFAFGNGAIASDWAEPSGSNAAFGWSGGENISDYFGSPSISEEGFVFAPEDFIAEVTTEGVGGVAADQALVTVDTSGASGGPAPAVTEFIVAEWGTYSGDHSYFSIQADVSVLRLVPYQGTTGSLELGWEGVEGAIDWDWDGPGTWRMERTDFLDNPLNWNMFSVTFTNSIEVDGIAPVGTFIQKTGAEMIVPEPGSLALLLFGVCVVLRRSS